MQILTHTNMKSETKENRRIEAKNDVNKTRKRTQQQKEKRTAE